MMEFINNLGITTTSGLIGLGLLLVGFFLILAGSGIISIEKVTVKQGRATWIVGIVLAAIGGFLFYPELAGPEIPSAPAAEIEVTQPSPTLPEEGESGGSSDWRTIQIKYPGNNLWREQNEAYTAVGSQNTIAWSEESFAGDLEISLEVSSSSSSYSQANIIVYGNGSFLTKGNLIFTIGSDNLEIWETSIFDGEGGSYLYAIPASVDLENQVHTVLISIKDRKASLSLDGDVVGTVFLADDIRSEGKIGLLKIWSISDITFAKIRVRENPADN